MKTIIISLICLSTLALSMFTQKDAQAEENYNKASGELNYMLQCQGCHKVNGEGLGAEVPSLKEFGREMLQMEEGRRFFILVPGSSLSPLSDQELADVLNYIMIDLIDIDSEAEKIPLFSRQEIHTYRGYHVPDVFKERDRLVGIIRAEARKPKQ